MKPMVALVTVFVFFCFSIVDAATQATAGPDEPTFQHTVKKGETVSLICIDYYGYYSPAMGKTILKENPSVKDVNIIFPGQVFTLHNPDYKPQKASEATALFEKKVDATQGVVTYVEGDVTLAPKGSKTRQKCAANTIVYPGDVIQTAANGRVELIINRETVVRVRENTRLIVDAFRDAEKNQGKTRMGFSLGSVWAKMKKFKDKVSRFELELPTAIAGVHGTVYQASVDRDSSAEVKVFTGEVAVKNNPALSRSQGGVGEVSGPDEVSGPSEVSMDQWVSIVSEMQKIRIDKKGKPKAVEPFKKNVADSWEQWNTERDKRISELFEETEE
jgi:LysM repeat protein